MTTLSLVRRIRAPLQTVFDAVTTADGIAQWWGPDAGPVLVAEADPRVGGCYRVRFRKLDGTEHESSGEFLEIVPPERIVMSWRWKGRVEDPGQSRVEITLKAVRDGTELKFVHSQLHDEPTRRSHEQGWTGSLDKLKACFSAATSALAREKKFMMEKPISRRRILEAGACALAAAAGTPPMASAHAETGLSRKGEDTIRKYYAAWEHKDWRRIDTLLAGNFTFSSANNDDHLSKSAFKKRCWESQIDFIERFELQRVIGNGNDAFVMYVCRTKNGKTFRNVEYFRLEDDMVQAIECYFGAQSSFPSAVSAAQR